MRRYLPLFAFEIFCKALPNRPFPPMLAKIYSAAVYGVDAYEVEIEVNAGAGDPKMVTVGLPDAAVKERNDRVRTAIANSACKWSRKRTTINLAPADIKKEGPSFGIPMALGMHAGAAELNTFSLVKFSFVGELSLLPTRGDLTGFFATHQNNDIDFADVKAQAHVKRAIEVAVAGGHNILMIGPPGSGKSMLSKRIPTIIPPMSLDEAIETTKIHSIAGFLDGEKSFVATRPFRSPHHTISDIGLLGGGAFPTPGEVSLAHNGVLFLRELPEFKRSALEVMRQPLEDGKVTISRAAGSLTFPSEFMLVAAMNPCPCGYFGDLKRECRCSPVQVQRYRQRISGPLLDRIDLHIEVPAVEYRDISSTRTEESSDAIRERVQRAREKQQTRFHSDRKVNCNARMGPRQIKQHCKLSDESQELIRVAMTELNLSARAYDRILKVSRTVADLAASDAITSEHVSEAIQYRTFDRTLWI